MIEVIEYLNLGEWAVMVLSIVVLWRWVVKSLVEKWFQNKLDLQKQEVVSTLQIQKDIAIRNAEFQKVKLERVLPLLEDINSVISEHKLMNNSYVSWIANKAGIPEDFERKRVSLDGRLLKSLYSAEIYLPIQFRALIRQIRKIVSCSWKDPLPIYYLLFEKGAFICVMDVCNDSNDLYSDLLNCFYDMCNKYLGISKCEESYSEILNRHRFSNDINPIDPNPAQSFLWKFILVHEYVNGDERLEAIRGIERAYKVSEE